MIESDLLTPMSSSTTSNAYILKITNKHLPFSILSINGTASLNQPWRYEIVVTSSDTQIQVDAILAQHATLTFQPPLRPILLNTLSSLTPPTLPRTLYGVITEFSQIAVNRQEARYKLVLEPRLALLKLHHYSAIYQNQSVIAVVEQVLRKHGFTGIDYRLDLRDTYPMREFITQWQESDLAFIQRILADIGVWLRFETDNEHNCEVVIISDNQQGFAEGGIITYQPPSGTDDGGTHSVWDLQLQSKMVPQSVQVQNYNYRQANSDHLAQVNSQPDDNTTEGNHYLYGEHYQKKGDIDTPESGTWYATLRHQQYISQQRIITGKSNQYNLTPGQRIIINHAPLAQDISQGLIILSTHGTGNRSDSYQLTFTAIPFNQLKPYRPPVLPMPRINGTLPARVTSPDNDTYGYIDTQGRYRVKFNFDLNEWQRGQESLWLRLAKPYAGETYGFHFPLIDGTEVAIAFTQGNPNRPYIAYALHNSVHPDPISTKNKHRNVIRTPANNKLRMDDKRGQEHIKLATEYGKTQLNLGHIVDQQHNPRGEGFELRTDKWGTISANSGLYLTTTTAPKAKDKQLDMQQVITQLENALSIAKSLQQTADNANAYPADIESQRQLTQSLTNLSQNGLLAYAEQGIGLTSPENIQLSSGNTTTLTAQANTDISSLKKITLAAGEALSFFAHKMGIKLFASKGKVEIQAQNDALALMAKDNLTIDSVNGETTLTAEKGITLLSGGSYIKISQQGIELGTENPIRLKCSLIQKMGQKSQRYEPRYLPAFCDRNYSLSLDFRDSDLSPMANVPYKIKFIGGKVIEGVLDENGYAYHESVPLEKGTVTYHLPDPLPETAWGDYQPLLTELEKINE
jgi:type VI secretion system secreted protein VgrG